jgi:hypothetical protein
VIHTLRHGEPVVLVIAVGHRRSVDRRVAGRKFGNFLQQPVRHAPRGADVVIPGQPTQYRHATRLLVPHRPPRHAG